MKASKVFISYTHDSNSHMKRVLELSERLRSDGADCIIDQYEVSPPEGWPPWMRRQIKEADFVLVICTENYARRYDGLEEKGRGAGAKWEGAIIGQQLYDAEGRNTKFIPVVFTHDDLQYVPIDMRGGTHYVLDSDARYDDLYGHLTEQPKTIKGKLGELRQLPSSVKKDSVASKVAKAPQETVPVVPSETVESHLSLVLLIQPGGTALFVRAQRIRVRGKMITLAIAPSDPRQTAAIAALERTREPIGIAYNLTALFVRVKSIEQVIENEEVWHLELEEDEYATRGGLFEVSFSAYSNEQIAEMRARRILLDEKVGDILRGKPDDFNKQFLENSLQGGYDSKFAIVRSPLPELYSEFHGNIDEFREAARLYSVLLLLLTHTVNQIFKIDFELPSEGRLSVDFEGVRPPRYSNEDPMIVRVQGTCSLK